MRCLICSQDGLPIDTIDCPNCGVHLPHLLRDCLPSGTLLHNRYRIDYPLGRGGFGITYRAFDTRLDRPVAVKEFYPQEHAFRENKTGKLIVHQTKQEAYQRNLQRFIKEGITLAKLNHPSLVMVHDSFQGKQTAYLVMKLIEGTTLRAKLDRRAGQPLSAERVQAIMSSLVEALSVAHEQQIYHLDLSPDNVMIDSHSQAVVLIDFGASRQGLGSSTTQSYKEAYAPIEVIDGKGFGAWSDVFELGMMLYEMLTGTLPPKALSRLVGEADWIPDLPEPWQRLVSSATCLYKEHRPRSVQEWWSLQYMSKPLVTEPPVTELPVTKPPVKPLIKPPVVKPPVVKPLVTEPLVTEPLVIKQPKPTDTELPSPVQPAIQPAGFALRLMADSIDRTLLLIASAIFHQVQGFAAYSTTDNYLGQILGIYIVLAFIYCPVMDSSAAQGTLGKLLVGIAVTDLRGQKLQLGRAYNRHICKIFSYLPALIGFFMAGFTHNKQALHDRIAKCLVIKRIQHEYTAS